MNDNKKFNEEAFIYDIVLGIVSPIGSNTRKLTDSIQRICENKEIRYSVITVSTAFGLSDAGLSHYERVKSKLESGNEFRSKYGNNILSFYTMSRIRKLRSKNTDTVFVVKSLKHPDEVEHLKLIYGKSFFLIGAYNSPEKRREFMRDEWKLDEDDISKIEQLDSAAKDSPGSQVSRLFPKCDFFIDLELEQTNFDSEISRFLCLIMGQPWYSPTLDETFIFQAFATSIRSLDLSRQVGAVLTDGMGEVISVGYNEVPKYGGGPYLEPFENRSDKQGRDYILGRDANKLQIEMFSRRLFDHLRSLRVLDSIEEVNYSETPLNELTEFGRAVHAEMDCLLSAARKGVKTRHSVLYVTTFPCHNCAKHILASGVKKVVFVEPYPKSKAVDLYPGEIYIGIDDKKTSDTNSRLLLSQFCGIGPNRYFDLFSMNYGDGIGLSRSDSSGRVKENLPLKSRYPIPQIRVAYWEAQASKKMLMAYKSIRKLSETETVELEKIDEYVNNIDAIYTFLVSA